MLWSALFEGGEGGGRRASTRNNPRKDAHCSKTDFRSPFFCATFGFRKRVDFYLRDQILENRAYTKLTTSWKLKVTHKKTPELKNRFQSIRYASFLKFRPYLNKKFSLQTREPDSETLTSDTQEPVG